jgi:hypothetical protein
MPNWIKTTFTLEVTQQDFDAADRQRFYRDTSYVCPSSHAARRLFPNCESARFGWGYGSVYYEEEIHNFDVVEATEHIAFEQNWSDGLAVTPRTFTISLISTKTKPGASTVTPRRYSKKPGPTGKMGI